jgi:hypothetical protein
MWLLFSYFLLLLPTRITVISHCALNSHHYCRYSYSYYSYSWHYFYKYSYVNFKDRIVSSLDSSLFILILILIIVQLLCRLGGPL